MTRDDIRKLVFLLLIVIVLGSFTFASQKAIKQDAIYTEDQTTYSTAYSLYIEGDFKEAYSLTSALVHDYEENEFVHRLHAQIATALSEFDVAKVHFEKTLAINPHLVENPEFLIEFGVALKNGKYFAEAVTVFSKCLSLNITEDELKDFQQVAEKHLEELKS